MRVLCVFLSVLMLVRPCGAIRKKRVALTFDDGPHAQYTAEILKILYENDAVATFFVIGSNAQRYPELVRAEYDLGHEIGNHTYSHIICGKADNNTLLDEIRTTDGIISDITGQIPTLFRPPEGKTGAGLVALNEYGKTVVLWDVDTRDWAHTSPEAIIKNIKANVHDGSIILFHDFVSAPSPTPEVLKQIIPYLREQGYEFVTVSGLLAEKTDTGLKPSFFIGIKTALPAKHNAAGNRRINDRRTGRI